MCFRCWVESEVFSVAATLGDDVDGAGVVFHGFPPMILSVHKFFENFLVNLFDF